VLFKERLSGVNVGGIPACIGGLLW